MATPTLKYVAPTTPEAELTFAPEPVVIYGVPSGGGGGGAVDSVNGQTGVVELAVADIPDLQDELDSKAVASEVADFALSVSGQFTTVAGQIATKANTSDVVPNTRTVAGKALSANVTLVKGDVGLSNVDNTADSAKPVSTAQQTALDLKAPLASPTFTGTVSGVTKAMVGLGSVDNTSDANKPVSTAQQTALNAKVNTADVAGLNTVGWGRAVFIANGGTVPGGTPAYTIVIEAGA